MPNLTAPRLRVDPVLILILLGSLGLTTHRIGHPNLHYYDESFHAIVAQNLLKHPLTPTLIDRPYLAYDPTRWSESRVWLHKPILPLWGIAASFAMLGVSTFALRLPSALLATGAVGLTYLIGRDLFDRRTGLIAAGLQAINPAIAMLVQGYLFSDHIDISLLFWVEVGAYFLVRAARTGAWRDVAAVGVAQGLAYLSKSYLAALLTGLAAVAWLAPVVGLVARDEVKLRGRHLVGLVGVTVGTAAPWLLWCAWRFPVEFAHEHGYVFTHLGRGVENWGGPWDRVIFDYLITLNHAFYPATIVATGVMLGRAGRGRRLAPWFVLAWLGGVLVPHLIAATKTPSATLIGLPAGLVILARLIAGGMEGQPRALVVWASVMVAGVAWPGSIGRYGRGWPDPPVWGGVMWQGRWVWEQVGLAGGLAVILGIIRWRRGGDAPSVAEPHAVPARPKMPPLGPPYLTLRSLGLGLGWMGAWAGQRSRLPGLDPWMRRLRAAAIGATVLVAARVILAAVVVTETGEGGPFVGAMARATRDRLPPNAVLLFSGPDTGEHQTAMFLLDRTCYPLRGRAVDPVAREVARAGGRPFVVTRRTGAGPCWFLSPVDFRGLYEWPSPPR